MTKKRKKRIDQKDEQSSVYFLKVFSVYGSWFLVLRLDNGTSAFGLPVGLGVGLILSSHEHFQLDKKIEIAILLVMTVFSFFLPFGLVVDL